jgi:hypothetical protein
VVEEVNDLYIRHFQQPLIPVDTTVANLIAHQLIGEALPTSWMKWCITRWTKCSTTRALRGVGGGYRDKLSSPEPEAWKRWPCLSRQLGVELGQPA